MLAIFHHIFQPDYPEPMEGNGTFLPQFLNLLNGATEIVNPLNMYRALFREHLNVMNFNDLMTQYQGVELYLG